MIDRVTALILPKCQGPEDVRILDRLLGSAERRASTASRVQVVANVETSAGVLAGADIAGATPRVYGLLFGAADLSAELGIRSTPEGTEFAYARSHVVLAAMSQGVVAFDGPYLQLDDQEGLAISTAEARRLGFGGKAAIHPGQLPEIIQQFAPSEDELDRATSVVRAFADAQAAGSSGAIRLEDGTFVDRAVHTNAKRMHAWEADRGDRTT